MDTKALWPRSYALFEEHTLYGARLSRTEVALLRRLTGFDVFAQVCVDAGWTDA